MPKAKDNILIFHLRLNVDNPVHMKIQDLVNNELIFMPNRLDYLSEIVLRDKEEKKAYANNKYGLIEYTLKPFSIEMSYKNRSGERITEETGYRKLYEVLSYMIKAPLYCDEAQHKYYDKMMAGDRDKLQPIYQKFLDMCDKRAVYLAKKGINPSDTINTVPKQNKLNFQYNLRELLKGGAKSRYKWNVEAVKLLKQIEAEGRLATAEEQKNLSCYVG